MKQIKFQLAILIISLLLISCNNKGNSVTSSTEVESSVIEENETDDDISTPVFPIDVKEDISNKVKAYTIIGQEMVNNNTRVNYIIRTPKQYDDKDLYMILCYLPEAIKIPTKDYTIDYYTTNQSTEGLPYGVASAINGSYTSNTNVKETKSASNVKRDFVGKWVIVSGDIMTIYKDNGKYYIDHEINGVMENDPVEVVKTTINGHTGFKYKHPDEWAEEYEIVNGGMYARDPGLTSGGMFFNNAE